MELGSCWDEQSRFGALDKFTPVDLRMMLEHFEPLQNLIRQIANGSVVHQSTSTSAPASVYTVESTTPDAQLQHQLQKANTALKHLQNQANEDASKLKAATECIEQQNAQIATLKDDKAQLEQQVMSLQKRTEKFQPLTELQTLRDDTVLARNLGLDIPADDQQALIVMVAVLSQKDNLERLWDNLKERCETEKRSANTQEMNLLCSALGWYNNNWKLRPFQLLHPLEGESFNFEQQQKSKYKTDGETLSQTLLPGLADGAGKPLRKTLVLTC
jgi:myosin heavy subunit